MAILIPDGNLPPDMPQNDVLGRDIMSQAMQILGTAGATDLTLAQIEELKALGLTSEQNCYLHCIHNYWSHIRDNL